jgi:hypothetical protein
VQQALAVPPVPEEESVPKELVAVSEQCLPGESEQCRLLLESVPSSLSVRRVRFPRGVPAA